jgi:hypothetical protein
MALTNVGKACSVPQTRLTLTVDRGWRVKTKGPKGFPHDEEGRFTDRT